MAQNRLKLGILGVQRISHELRGTFSYNHMQGGYSCKESEFLLQKWPSSPRTGPALLSCESALVRSVSSLKRVFFRSTIGQVGGLRRAMQRCL